MNDMITIPKEEYEQLKEASIDAADLMAVLEYKAHVSAGTARGTPHEVLAEIINGVSPLKAWRVFRGLTQVSLAELSKANRVQIANIEGGTKTGSVDTLKKLADALGITVDDLL